jgi:hypothetical protein
MSASTKKHSCRTHREENNEAATASATVQRRSAHKCADDYRRVQRLRVMLACSGATVNRMLHHCLETCAAEILSRVSSASCRKESAMQTLCVKNSHSARC